MFGYELKKLCLKKIVVIAALLFVLLDIVKIGMLYNQIIAVDPLYQGRQKVLAQLRGVMTTEKLSFVIARQRELEELVSSGTYSTKPDSDTYSGYQFGDAMIFNGLYEELDYAYHYGKNLEKVRQKAAENISLFPSESYEVKKSEKILRTYDNRVIVEFYDTTGYKNYLMYDFSTLLVLLLLLLIISPVFAEEKEIKMHLLISTSPVGSRSAAWVKTGASLLLAAVMPVLFCCLDFAAFSVLFHLEGGTNPLYSIDSFMYTFFDGSIYQYIFLSLLLKIMGSVFFSTLFLLLSSFFSRVLPVFFCGGATVLLCIMGKDYIDSPLWQQWNPINLFTNYTITGSFNHVNLFGRPVNALFLLLFILLIFIISMLFILLRGKKIKWAQ